MSSRIFVASDELYHHGIKGQKKGFRRYQYEDGSLTPAGKIRYGTNKSSGHGVEGTGNSGNTGASGGSSSQTLGTSHPSKNNNDTLKTVSNSLGQINNALPNIKNMAASIASNRDAKKDVSKMTTKELQDAVQRMNLERSYLSLTKSEVNSGKQKVETIFNAGMGLLSLASMGIGIATGINNLKKNN